MYTPSRTAELIRSLTNVASVMLSHHWSSVERGREKSSISSNWVSRTWSTFITAERGDSQIEKEGETLSFAGTRAFFVPSRLAGGERFHFCAFGTSSWRESYSSLSPPYANVYVERGSGELSVSGEEIGRERALWAKRKRGWRKRRRKRSFEGGLVRPTSGNGLV